MCIWTTHREGGAIIPWGGGQNLMIGIIDENDYEFGPPLTIDGAVHKCSVPACSMEEFVTR